MFNMLNKKSTVVLFFLLIVVASIGLVSCSNVESNNSVSDTDDSDTTTSIVDKVSEEQRYEDTVLTVQSKENHIIVEATGDTTDEAVCEIEVKDKEKIHLESYVVYGNIYVQIKDALGEEHYNEALSNERVSTDIDVKPGMYTVSIRSTDATGIVEIEPVE